MPLFLDESLPLLPLLLVNPDLAVSALHAVLELAVLDAPGWDDAGLISLRW
jgi:hypothetical protein